MIEMEKMALALRRAIAADPSLPHAVMDGTRKTAREGEILIGVGRWSYGDVAIIDHHGICLQNKGCDARVGRVYDSVSRFVVEAPADLVDEWRGKVISMGIALDDVSHLLRRFCLVVEDISPDSVFALLVFLVRLNGEFPADAYPLLEYIEHWEAGDVRSTGEPERSLGVALSSLVHQAFAYTQPRITGDGNPQTVGVTGARYAGRGASLSDEVEPLVVGWRDALRLVAEVIEAEVDPRALPDIPIGPCHAQAQAHVRYERQVYLKNLGTARKLQLMIPIGHAGRWMLVDAYLAEERLPLGSVKAFLRNDRTNTELANGFTLMAIYRPTARGTGNDMVVTLDPASGCRLDDLWVQLELLEEQKWQGMRPDDQPRCGTAGYPGGKRSDGSNAPNEPWWDGGNSSQKHTIVAAPKSVIGPDGRCQAGSRLDWADVREAIWNTYAPINGLWVEGDEGAGCWLNQSSRYSETREIANGERLVFAKVSWGEAETGSLKSEDIHALGRRQAFQLVPTVLAAFAAILADVREGRKSGLPGMDSMPEKHAYDVVEIEGGTAVVSRDGVFVFDDWRVQPVDTNTLRTEFEAVCRRLDAIFTTQHALGVIKKTLDDAEQGKRVDIDLRLAELGKERKKIREEIDSTGPSSLRYDVTCFRTALEKRWEVMGRLEDLQGRFEECYRELTSIRNSRTDHYVRLITVYAVPIGLTAQLFGFAFVDMPDPLGGWFTKALAIQPPLHLTAVSLAICIAASAVALVSKSWKHFSRAR